MPKILNIWVWGPISLLIGFLPLLPAQIIQLASLLVLPFSRAQFRRINTWVAGGVWGYWAWMIQHAAGTTVHIIGDQLPSKEDAIVIANHQSMADIVAILCVALPKGRIGDLKWLVKDMLKYVPGVGWGMLFLDCIFLKRDWMKDQQSILKTFSHIAQNKLPVWLVSFPEGTRITADKLATAQHSDRQRGQHVHQHLLRPKARGFAAAVTGLKSHVTAVYSLTIYYGQKVPTLVELIRGDCREITIHVRRVAIAEVASGGDEQSIAWLMEDSRRKDRLISGFKDPSILKA